MFLVNLRHCAKILQNVVGDAELAAEAMKLAQEIDDAVQNYGGFGWCLWRAAVLNHPFKGKVLAYEVDGFGSAYFMDDANIPSLLSLPYLGFCRVFWWFAGYLDKNDPLYRSTRELILSEFNPYFFKGAAGEGIGGPHVGPGYIWPMSIIMRAYTSDVRGSMGVKWRMLMKSWSVWRYWRRVPRTGTCMRVSRRIMWMDTRDRGSHGRIVCLEICLSIWWIAILNWFCIGGLFVEYEFGRCAYVGRLYVSIELYWYCF